MHEWGDNDFDWEALNKAVDHYWWWLYYIAGMCVYTKEKWGTLRIESFYMGKVYYSIFKKPYFIRNLIEKVINTILPQKVIFNYQKLVFNLATIIAAKKWPHIKKEMTCEILFDDLLYKWVKKKIRYESVWHKF